MIKYTGDKNSKYEVKRVNIKNIDSMQEYEKAIHNATTVYCDCLDDIWNFCGGKLHRERSGYSGISGNFEYVAIRIK